MKYRVHIVVLIFAVWNVFASEFVLKPDAAMPAEEECVPEPPVAPPSGAGEVVFDLHGNYWALGPGEDAEQRLFYVLPAQEGSAWVKDELSGLTSSAWKWVLADEFGTIWVSDGGRLQCLDPRHPEKGWCVVSDDPAFPASPITAMANSPSGGIMVAFQDGSCAEFDQRPKYRKNISYSPAPAHIQQLVTDPHGSIWALAKGKVYCKEAPADAWQRTWELVARMPGGSHDLGGDVLNGRFYMDWSITGDFGYPSTGCIHRKLLQFDPVVQAWEVAVDYGLPRGYCGVGMLDEKIWTVAGDALNEQGERYSSRISQIYDPTTDRLSAGPDLPVALPSALALGCGNRLYILGFKADNDGVLKLFSMGKGESDWRIEPDGPAGLGASYGTVLDGRIYTVVGHRYISIFDTKTGSWEQTVAPHSPRASALCHYKGEIWVLGGRTTEGSRVSYIYNPTSKQWRKGPPLPCDVIWGCAFNMDGELYLTGGAAGGCYHNRTFRLRASQR